MQNAQSMQICIRHFPTPQTMSITFPLKNLAVNIISGLTHCMYSSGKWTKYTNQWLPDFRTFPPDDLLGLFTCQRGYIQGYKTSKIASVAICGRSCHIMPVLLFYSHDPNPTLLDVDSRMRRRCSENSQRKVSSSRWPSIRSSTSTRVTSSNPSTTITWS